MGLFDSSFYHITLVPRVGVTAKEVQAKMDLAMDWFKYGPHNWIVYTDKTAADWTRRLENFAKPSGELFVCRLDVSDTQGWMPEEFWKWFRKRGR